MTVDNSFTMKKFQSMEIIYVTFSQITKLPYVECDPETFDDQVCLPKKKQLKNLQNPM